MFFIVLIIIEHVVVPCVSSKIKSFRLKYATVTTLVGVRVHRHKMVCVVYMNQNDLIFIKVLVLQFGVELL